MRTKTWLTGLGLAVLLAVSACGGSAEDDGATGDTADGTAVAGADDGGSTATAGPDEADSTAAAPPTAEVADVPDVVAEVNGEEITKEEFVEVYQDQFEQQSLQAQMSGQDVDQDLLKEQILDAMVGNLLLEQEAEARELTASEEETAALLDELAAANGLESGDALRDALTEQGLTEEEVRAELERQVRIDKLIAEESGLEAPGEEELRELYDSLVEQQEAAGSDSGLPSFEDVRPRLEEQLTSQQESEAVQTLVDELREAADITINL